MMQFENFKWVLILGILVMNLNFCQKCEKVIIKGITGNAKLGGIVETENKEVYYIEGIDNWGGNTGKSIIVTGCLNKIKHTDKKENDNQIIQTVDNGVWVKKIIQNPKWKFADK
ncbi:MAG: hypothetical protein LBE92_07345 [Chryseobacterium sp.]|jgi:hypothetical protein|uniref:hypothetical protein n=1 Tax=Chryseobacterium sp. TaxID=1871047 RepID=UPI0028334081|nr:hypothetical protein [Chryseobacterium sp.]MDR2235921.1 hypothetical protein [Chryseobacterium sp.]